MCVCACVRARVSLVHSLVECSAFPCTLSSDKYVFTRQAVMKGHSNAVYVCRFNEHFSQCLTGSADKSIILWQVVSAEGLKEGEGLS